MGRGGPDGQQGGVWRASWTRGYFRSFPPAPFFLEFASALRVIAVFVGQPKQGWVLNLSSSAALLLKGLASFHRTSEYVPTSVGGEGK